MRRWRLWIVCLVVVSASACGSLAPPAPVARSAPDRPTPADVGSVAATHPAERAVALARSLLEVPYRYSGADPSGFDCSGLTWYVFSKVGLGLPRTASSQAGVGRWVAPDELARGDLVFFGADREKPMHVGLVVSSPGEALTMIHSSSSRGVIETEVLSNSYWLSRLSFGRRVLEPR